MPRRLSLKQRKFIDEYLKNGGNASAAAFEAYNTTPSVASSIGSENLRKPAIRNEIERHLCTSGVEQALEVVFEALHAKTQNGRPHWVSRLRAADMIFRLGHAYDRKGPEEKAEEVKVTFDWSNVPLEITKYYAMYGQWPEPEIEQKLKDGATVRQLKSEINAEPQPWRSR